MEDTFTSCVSDNRLEFWIYKELQQLNIKEYNCQSINELTTLKFLKRRNTMTNNYVFKIFNISSGQEMQIKNYFEILPHASQNGYPQDIWQQMLERAWAMNNPYSLLVGEQINTAIVESTY